MTKAQTFLSLACVAAAIVLVAVIASGISKACRNYEIRQDQEAAAYTAAVQYQQTVQAREPHQHDWRSVAYLAAHQSGLGIVEVVRCPDCRQSAYIVLQPISSTATYRTTP